MKVGTLRELTGIDGHWSDTENFNFFCIVAELKRNQIRNCQYIFIGQTYSLLVEIISKYFLNISSSDTINKIDSNVNISEDDLNRKITWKNPKNTAI